MILSPTDALVMAACKLCPGQTIQEAASLRAPASKNPTTTKVTSPVLFVFVGISISFAATT
jgi:hypothetical protein